MLMVFLMKLFANNFPFYFFLIIISLFIKVFHYFLMERNLLNNMSASVSAFSIFNILHSSFILLIRSSQPS